MKFTIPALLLVAISHAAEVKLPSRILQKAEDEEYELAKRALLEGDFGLRTSSFLDAQSVNAGIEYADSKPELSDDSPIQQLYATPIPRIAKISDVLTGQGPPFHTTINSHLYSPVSIYQPRLGSPTTYEDYSDSSYDHYKHLPQSVQTLKPSKYPHFEQPKQTKYFTTETSSFNPFDISKPSFTSLGSSDHFFPHFGSPGQFYPNYESSGQFSPIYKTAGQSSFSSLKQPGNSNTTNNVTSAQSTASNPAKQKVFSDIEYPQSLSEVGFTPNQLYQLINHLENESELYTEAKATPYSGSGQVNAPVDYLQAPSPGIVYANAEPLGHNYQLSQHAVKTAQVELVSEGQQSVPKQNDHPNGAVSYARFSQSLPIQRQEQLQSLQLELPQPQQQSTSQPLLQSSPLVTQQTQSQLTIEITTKQPSTLLPQYSTTVGPTFPALAPLTLPTSTTPNEKITTISQPQLTTLRPQIISAPQPTPTPRPQTSTTLEFSPTTTKQSQTQPPSLYTLQPQSLATQSLTTTLPHYLPTAQPVLPLNPDGSPGIHPLPYQFSPWIPIQKNNQITQQSFQVSQLYQQPQKSYQGPQQLYKPPQQSNQTPQQLYKPPQQSNLTPQQLYKPPQQSNQTPQQLYKPPQQSNQTPQQLYKPPQLSYQTPQPLYKLPQQSYQPPQQLYKPPQQLHQHTQQSLQPPEPYQQQPQQLYQQSQLKEQQYSQTKSQSRPKPLSVGKQASQKSYSNPAEYYAGNTILTPLLQGPIYSGTAELILPEPRYHATLAVSSPSIQYFGKYAESIFGGVH